jgi:predicted dehydrogenase
MIKGRGAKVGLIGLGSMGKNHARIAAALNGINLIGIADINAGSHSLAQDLGVPAFTDYKELFPLSEALIIAAPTETHYQTALDCLNAGKHLLIEKPFTGSSAKARSLGALAKEKNLILAAGFIERFNPAFQRLLKEIGGEKIVGIDIKRLSPFPERIADTDVIFDMMVHDLDLVQLLAPEEIIGLKAKGEKIRTKMLDRVIAHLTFRSGAIALIEASRVFGDRTRRISVTTEKYLVEADLLNKTIYLRDFTSPTPSTTPVKPVDQLTEELKDFVAAIKGKKQPAVSCDDAIKTLALAEEVKKAC